MGPNLHGELATCPMWQKANTARDLRGQSDVLCACHPAPSRTNRNYSLPIDGFYVRRVVPTVNPKRKSHNSARPYTLAAPSGAGWQQAGTGFKRMPVKLTISGPLCGVVKDYHSAPEVRSTLSCYRSSLNG